MCDCFKDIEEKMKARLMEKVPEGSHMVTSSFDGAGWFNQCLNFSSGKVEVMLKYTLVYRAQKKNKELAKNLTRLDSSVRMSYCPFCGEKQL